jgi:DNA repair protein RadD
MNLRYYQKEAITKAIENNNGYINLCTGSGKSVVIAETCNSINEKTLILQPSLEILQQNYQKLKQYQNNLDIGIYSASAGKKDIGKYTFATIGSIIKYVNQLKDFKNVLIDECHLVNSAEGQYKKLIDFLQPTKIIGFTGTPFRTGSVFNMQTGQHEGVVKFLHRTKPAIFKKMLYSYNIKQALNDGYVCPIKYITQKYKTDDLQFNSTGDYTERSIFNNNKKNNIYTQIAKICKTLTKENFFRGCVIFVASVDEAKYVASLMQSAGFSVASVDGKTNQNERKQILDDFKAGIIKFVINVGILTTGFNYPELDTMILARPTFSLGLYWQMVGRVIRIAENKHYATVYDLCGNVERMGQVEQAEFLGVDTYNTGLVCGNKILIEQIKQKNTLDINTNPVVIKIPNDDKEASQKIEKLLKINSVSNNEKSIIAEKRQGGKFDGKYLVEIPKYNVSWLQENGYDGLASKIIKAKLLLENLKIHLI